MSGFGIWHLWRSLGYWFLRIWVRELGYSAALVGTAFLKSRNPLGVTMNCFWLRKNQLVFELWLTVHVLESQEVMKISQSGEFMHVVSVAPFAMAMFSTSLFRGFEGLNISRPWGIVDVRN